MKTWKIQDREAGNLIEKFYSLEEAQTALAEYEQEDKENGTYTEDFYEIVEPADVDDIAYQYGLQTKETTSERSGYPRNLQTAITGFDSFEQAQAIAKKFDLDLIWITRREGQQLWSRMGTAYQPMEISSGDFGDDYEFWNDADSTKEYYYEILGDMVRDGKSFEAIREYMDKIEEVFDAIEDLDNDEMVVTRCGEFYRTQKVHCISFDDGDGHYTQLAAIQ